MKRHLQLVHSQETPEKTPQPSLIPVQIRGLDQTLALAQKLTHVLLEDLSKGMEEGLQLSQELTQDLQLTKISAQELLSELAKLAVLGLILEEE